VIKRSAARSALLLAVLFAAQGLPASAQTDRPAPPELAATLAALDREFFDSYNRCDLEKFASFLAEDVEFYHDKGGVTHGSKSLTESIRKNICGKVRREVVAASLEAHPIPGFGAVQMGSHKFYELALGPNAGPVGQAKFVSIWRHKDGAWKITRVISYDHGPAPK
jgi:ketosteroid isomerase-like protein